MTVGRNLALRKAVERGERECVKVLVDDARVKNLLEGEIQLRVVQMLKC